ncbi:ribosomal large subunit pseudouridine synthase A [Rhodoferax lithotrophicus]|uniref:Ribosomal large subunit pseudouridine synthase A n=1 Tax=Rhodoferax lithotrophicus TaxID=2798804 RepID=A0ABM7ML21_9BURK|nr:RluA family pseudouridine synthase [Rhodoferax sp. MIZ03]BCO26900.1 ribosomal large subunit pseudouridine synthase A [Rhodoferax sp. MIZ03]
MTEVQVVYVDDALLVLNKPAGLLSVPGKGVDKQDCLSNRAQRLYPDALVVHRLDMATSGLLIMARSSVAQRCLNDAFATRSIHKRYESIVDGLLCSPNTDWQLINLPIFLDWPNRPKRIINAQHGKPSTTRWRVLSTDQTRNTTRLLLEPITGRSHQLRVHLQALGHAILGDQLYAPPPVALASERLLLHACELKLNHPIRSEILHFVCPAPF